MLLSFSVASMRPMIVNGLREIAGEQFKGRVKRQTIRQFGPAYQRLFGDRRHMDGLTLDLWWKSRTADRFKFGQVPGSATRISIVRPRRVYGRDGVLIWNSHRDTYMTAITSCDDGDLSKSAVRFVADDGFDSVQDFIDYFVPKPGDTFEGVLFRW